MLRRHLTRTRLGLVLAVLSGVVLGAVFGQPGAGRAASQAVPKNKRLPTMAGTAVVGQTLTAIRGAWTGSPTSFRYAWIRCDASGQACLGITGATARIYTVTLSDEGHTLRLAVTARNASGATTATSQASVPVPPSGCPLGTGAIQVAALGPPARFTIAAASVARPVTRGTRTIRINLQVTACNGRPVQGALVYATPIPFNQFSGAQIHTDANGKATLTESRQRGFPASPHQRLLAVFVRASKEGEPLTAGVSTTRVVAFHVSHH